MGRPRRRRIPEAALRLFVDNGYAGTTVAAIAERAGVAPETIYLSLGGKRGLLEGVIETAITGADDRSTQEETWWAEVARLPGAPERHDRLTSQTERIRQYLGDHLGPGLSVSEAGERYCALVSPPRAGRRGAHREVVRLACGRTDRAREVEAMIARVWRGAVAAADGDAYAGYLEETGVADYRATPGNRGVQVLRREVDDRTEFVLVTLWDSTEAIAAFAGDDIEAAVYYDEDDRYLLERGPRVAHYTVTTFD